MKYLKQFTLIITISFIGELMNVLIPLSVPASVWGLILMLMLLLLRIIKPESIREASRLLLEIMPVTFIPAAVGLIEVWDDIAANIASYAVITIISTVLVMAVSGLTTQAVIKSSKKKGKKNERLS